MAFLNFCQLTKFFLQREYWNRDFFIFIWTFRTLNIEITKKNENIEKNPTNL